MAQRAPATMPALMSARLHPDPVLPRPPRHRARRVRLPARARRQHRGSGAVQRPRHRPVLHAGALRLRPAHARRTLRDATRSSSPRASAWTGSCTPPAQPMRTVILVSKEGHCLNDLLFRWKSGLLPVDIRAIVSNHRDFYQLAASYNVPFHHIPVTAGDQGAGRGEAARDHRGRGRRAGGAGALHADPERRPVPQAGRPRHQHPPLASCPASRAPSPTTRRTTAA